MSVTFEYTVTTDASAIGSLLANEPGSAFEVLREIAHHAEMEPDLLDKLAAEAVAECDLDHSVPDFLRRLADGVEAQLKADAQ